ncbi:MAG: beta-1,6-N-acetylglucosaminyltransferase [Verrucomicrobiota bacterium]|jgi:hypothetical protein
MVHKDFEQASRLARRLLSGDSGIVIHVNSKVKIPGNFLAELGEGRRSRVFLTEKRHFSEWGSWEAVLAILSLLDEGVRRFPAASYFTLLSGQDYPIKNAEYIDAFFRRNDSNFIGHIPLREEQWKYGGIRRINRFYWARNRKSIPGFFFRTIPCPPRRFPIPVEKIQVGSVWWTLKRDTIMKILDFVKKNPKILMAFRWTYVPDEMFLPTLLISFLGESKISRERIRYFENFSLPRDYLRLKILNRNGIRNLGVADFEKLESSPALFARKFDPTMDSKILDLLDGL